MPGEKIRIRRFVIDAAMVSERRRGRIGKTMYIFSGQYVKKSRFSEESGMRRAMTPYVSNLFSVIHAAIWVRELKPSLR